MLRQGQGQGGGQGWRQAVAGYVPADDMAGEDQEVGLPLSRTVCFYDRQSVSVTGCLCL